MRLLLQFSASAFLLVGLAGCASLSKSECEVGDWYALGKTDGYNGAAPVSKIASYNDACNKHGIYVDQPRYNQGHAEGLVGYCTLSRGVTEGKAGRQYAGLCLGQSDIEFREGHTIGTEHYHITQRINDTKRRIHAARAKQKKVPTSSPDYYKIDGDIRVWNTEINNLSVQQGQVQQRIDTLLASRPASGF